LTLFLAPSMFIWNSVEPQLLIIHQEIQHLLKREAIGAGCEVEMVNGPEIGCALMELVLNGSKGGGDGLLSKG